jgi:hypothetical protein
MMGRYYQYVSCDVDEYLMLEMDIKNGAVNLNEQNTFITSQKVVGLSPDEVDFSIDLILPAPLWPWG